MPAKVKVKFGEKKKRVIMTLSMKEFSLLMEYSQKKKHGLPHTTVATLLFKEILYKEVRKDKNLTSFLKNLNEQSEL